MPSYSIPIPWETQWSIVTGGFAVLADVTASPGDFGPHPWPRPAAWAVAGALDTMLAGVQAGNAAAELPYLEQYLVKEWDAVVELSVGCEEHVDALMLGLQDCQARKAGFFPALMDLMAWVRVALSPLRSVLNPDHVVIAAFNKSLDADALTENAAKAIQATVSASSDADMDAAVAKVHAMLSAYLEYEQGQHLVPPASKQSTLRHGWIPRMILPKVVASLQGTVESLKNCGPIELVEATVKLAARRTELIRKLFPERFVPASSMAVAEEALSDGVWHVVAKSSIIVDNLSRMTAESGNFDDYVKTLSGVPEKHFAAFQHVTARHFRCLCEADVHKHEKNPADLVAALAARSRAIVVFAARDDLVARALRAVLGANEGILLPALLSSFTTVQPGTPGVADALTVAKSLPAATSATLKKKLVERTAITLFGSITSTTHLFDIAIEKLPLVVALRTAASHEGAARVVQRATAMVDDFAAAMKRGAAPGVPSYFQCCVADKNAWPSFKQDSYVRVTNKFVESAQQTVETHLLKDMGAKSQTGIARRVDWVNHIGSIKLTHIASGVEVHGCPLFGIVLLAFDAKPSWFLVDLAKALDVGLGQLRPLLEPLCAVIDVDEKEKTAQLNEDKFAAMKEKSVHVLTLPPPHRLSSTGAAAAGDRYDASRLGKLSAERAVLRLLRERRGEGLTITQLIESSPAQGDGAPSVAALRAAVSSLMTKGFLKKVTADAATGGGMGEPSYSFM